MMQGVCVGGPLNGRKLVSQFDRHDIEAIPPVPARCDPDGEAPTKDSKRVVFTYKHHQMFSSDRNHRADTLHDFWIPLDESHPHKFIMESLMASHEQVGIYRKLIARAYKCLDWLMAGVKHISVPDYGELNKVLMETSQIEYEDRT